MKINKSEYFPWLGCVGRKLKKKRDTVTQINASATLTRIRRE
jgi:hypothetical protein